MDQSNLPLVQALKQYIGENALRQHMPGHKGGAGAPLPAQELLGSQLWQADVTEIVGLDDLQEPDGCIAEAQRLLADLYGAANSFFLINGSSVGIAALLLACLRPGDEILVPRNAHRAVLSGLILSGAKPIFVQVRQDESSGAPLGLDTVDFLQAVEAHPQAKAAFFVNPTYQGVTGDLAALIQICRKHGLVTLVDEAHGVHFPWLPAGFLPMALSCGADACVQSAHKLAGSLTQSAWLHMGQGSALDLGRVKSALQWLQSSSPSYVLLASLDAARWQLAQEGKERLRRIWGQAEQLRRRWQALAGVDVFGGVEGTLAAPFQMDITKITLAVRGWSGHAAAAQLRRQGIAVEWADEERLLLLLSLADAEQNWERLEEALPQLLRLSIPGRFLQETMALPPVPPQRLTPREAAMAEYRSVWLQEAQGLIAGEAITPYPPGIPLVLPGEELTAEVLAWIAVCKHQGQHMSGMADSTLETIRVVWK